MLINPVKSLFVLSKFLFRFYFLAVKQSISTSEDGAGQLLRLGQVGLGQEEEISEGAPEEPQSEQGSGQEAEAQETQEILFSQQ